MRFALVLASFVAASGCAAILKPQQQAVTVTSMTPGADVMVDGFPAGKTPARIGLSTKQDHTITVKNEKGEQACHFSSSVSVGWVVLDVVMTPAWIVDLVAGSWKSLDRADCMVPL